jgi:hypothetical protein
MKSVRVVAAAAMFFSDVAFACDPPLRGDHVQRIEGSRYVLAFRPSPAPRVSEFFTLDIAVCARNGSAPVEVRVDAQMPEHKHGMNYRPSVMRKGDGQFSAQGLMFHMPGRWQLTFDVRAGEASETLRADVRLGP